MTTTWYTIYTRSDPVCPYCVEAKELLQVYGMDYFEKDISTNETYKAEFLAEGHKRIPQIYREGTLIGGCDLLKQHLRINHSVKARQEAGVHKSSD